MESLVKTYNKYKNSEITHILISCILWSGVFIFAAYSYMALYQTFRDTYCNLSMICLVAVAFYVVNLNPFSKIGVICFGAYSVGVFKYLYRHNMDWGSEYRMVLITKFLLFALVALLVLRLVESKGREAFEFKFSIWNVFTFVIFLLTFSLSPKALCTVFCPILVIWFMKTEEETWRKQIEYIAYSVSISFSLLMIKSFIEEPQAFAEFRYTGIFHSLCVAGVLTGVAFACSVFLVYKGVKQNQKANLIWGIISLAVCLFAAVLFKNKSALFGMCSLIMTCYVLAQKKIKLSKVLLRIVVCAVAIIGMFIVMFFLLKSLSEIDYWAWSEEYAGTLRGIIQGYWIQLADLIFNNPPYESYFPEGSWLLVLDRLTSYRLTVWSGVGDAVTLLGNENIGIIDKTGREWPYAHNVFLSWIIAHGKIVGSLLIVWYISYIYKLVKLKNENRFWMWVPILWMGFCNGFFMFETEGWGAASLLFTLVFVKSVLICDGEKKTEIVSKLIEKKIRKKNGEQSK